MIEQNMNIKLHYFGQDDASKELYRLVILVKPENTETDKKLVKEKLSDFQYEHLQDGWIRMVRQRHEYSLQSPRPETGSFCYPQIPITTPHYKR